MTWSAFLQATRSGLAVRLRSLGQKGVASEVNSPVGKNSSKIQRVAPVALEKVPSNAKKDDPMDDVRKRYHIDNTFIKVSKFCRTLFYSYYSFSITNSGAHTIIRSTMVPFGPSAFNSLMTISILI
eukprot:scaffold38298_cov49-Attheya_sp.AAC.8